MKEIIEQLTEWQENIKYDINCDWNENKTLNLHQMMLIAQAIALLKLVVENNNIPN